MGTPKARDNRRTAEIEGPLFQALSPVQMHLLAWGLHSWVSEPFVQAFRGDDGGLLGQSS